MKATRQISVVLVYIVTRYACRVTTKAGMKPVFVDDILVEDIIMISSMSNVACQWVGQASIIQLGPS